MGYRKLLLLSVIIVTLSFYKQLFARVESADSLLQLLALSEEAEQAGILNNLSYLLLKDNTSQSIEYANRALSLSEQYNQPVEKYNALKNIAFALQKHDTSNTSLHYDMLALEVAQEMNDSLLIARAYFGLGSNYSAKGYFEEALENLLQAYLIVEDLYAKGDKVENSKGLSFITNNIANVLSRMGDKDKALEYYNYSLDWKTRLKDSTGIANVLNNLGLIYAAKGEFEKAKMHYQRSLEIKEKLSNTEDIAETVFNLWELMIKQEKYRQALAYFHDVQKIFNEFESRSRILMYNNLASVYLALNEPEYAYKNITDAITLAKKTNTIELLSASYLLLSEYYFEISNLKQAYFSQLEYIKLKDSVMNTEMVSKMAEMQTRYESEKKEKQIAILQKDKQLNQAELERQKAIQLLYAAFSLIVIFITAFVIVWIRSNQKRKRELLEKRNLEIEQKLLRAQMNPHFIFNSLNSVQGFISANDSFKAMSFLSKFGHLLRNILENSRKNLINLESELATLKLYIEMEKLRYKDAFDYEILVDKALDLESIMIPPLIIQPFVENAIKHGLDPKKEKGKLLISINKEGSQIQITINDNGIGRKKSNELSHSTKKHHKSFGVELTNERLENIGKTMGAKASLQIADSKDDNGNVCGTMVVLTIPYRNFT